jgi:hypothetical protein
MWILKLGQGLQKNKINVTAKGQERIFSGRYKLPVTSVSENLLNLSNSSFSYSDNETAWTKR